MCRKVVLLGGACQDLMDGVRGGGGGRVLRYLRRSGGSRDAARDGGGYILESLGRKGELSIVGVAWKKRGQHSISLIFNECTSYRGLAKRLGVASAPLEL